MLIGERRHQRIYSSSHSATSGARMRMEMSSIMAAKKGRQPMITHLFAAEPAVAYSGATARQSVLFLGLRPQCVGKWAEVACVVHCR
ncbi:hypothetical protein PhaeoP83_04176 (plasmid) [Phaeobacter inhibens]|uniref:Transposase n=1 Tax=Phaeobacter inhibens TaxID=221822 RepID=A0ABN5GTR5_9RHOB|nr:hypothetical protein PhaeoP83_04176 [Phaeobacter inhibens]AUQ96999.1 hypothetical protein PhaeoP66_04273 [Phaeobacter inhibens]AUR22199.1 hypothetical protein PhaeoP80_04176 [Phaeobacter inhibens]